MINYQVICSLALEKYFAMSIRMLFLYIKLLFLLVFQLFFEMNKIFKKLFKKNSKICF